ncbi:MAG: methylated-DNA--[protein]-cysteine S-methyltransferase [Deltaproteobacteria bacterium]|nr:methylated-DNA--[protein]-cysteine S-methyltransferase [Deltaproteobacteria bacterium]
MPGRDSADEATTLREGLQIAVAALKTPIGELQIAASGDRILAVELPRQQSGAPLFDEWLRGHLLAKTRPPALRQALLELREYFAGKRRRFTVALAPTGTEFQQRVWHAVAAIPFGKTTTYGAIAEQLGDKQRARAVGAAVGANPIPIFIPCHRVIGSNDDLTGYGGGLKRKIWLLRHEGVLLA